MKNSITTSIAPWLPVKNGGNAVSFYKKAFNAIETYRMEAPDGSIVVKLSVDGADFWVSGGAPDNVEPEASDTGLVRMVLTVSDPDNLYEQAIAAGASSVFPVGVEYGWRLGRVVDPFGYHWEIGRPLE